MSHNSDRQANGYGFPHMRLRRLWQARILDGDIRCARCGDLIAAREPWDLGHDDVDRSRYAGPEHRGCNRATSGRKRSFYSQRW